MTPEKETIIIKFPNGIQEPVELSTDRATLIRERDDGLCSVYAWLSHELVSTAPKPEAVA